MRNTIFLISKMDCVAEEYQVKMAISPLIQIKKIDFDLKQRRLSVSHTGNPQIIMDILLRLNLGVVTMESGKQDEQGTNVENAGPLVQEKSERFALRVAFLVNSIMFFVELVLGIRAESTGLIADSLDMFADAAVFALSFYVVGKSFEKKIFAAKMSGVLQLILAAGTLLEVVRRFFSTIEPVSSMMIVVSIVALVANVFCMKILSSHRNGEAHMKATWIFLSTDVIANIGVIFAGIFVYFLRSKIPDLMVGAVISIVVFNGSIRILNINMTKPGATD